MARKRIATPIRVLVYGLPRLLHAIVLDALRRVSDIEVANDADDKDLATAVKRAGADVVVTASRSSEANPLPGELFETNPRIRVFCIAADGRNAWQRELRLSTIGLGDVSPDELASMIRDHARQPLAAS